MERELLAYRASPTDSRFRDLYFVAQPWLRTVALGTVRRYRRLSVSGTLDDVVLEGAFAISRATRRYVYLCPTCGRAFLHRISLESHRREEHGRRGPCPGLVSLATFAKTSARLAMNRTARRLEAVPEDPDPDVGERVDAVEVEDGTALRVLLRSVRDRLTARARANLERLLRLEVLPETEVEILRYEVGAILHSD